MISPAKMFKIALYTAAISVGLSGMSVMGADLAYAQKLPPPAVQPTPPQGQGKLIQTREIDVTGDGQFEVVSLVGWQSDPNTAYFDKLFIAIVGQNQAQVVIPLPGGYNPKMDFCDFIHDGMPQIYVTSDTGGSGGYTTNHIYSLKNNVPTAIPMPGPLHADATFKKNYKVKMKIQETGKSFTLDIADRKEAYEQFGIYSHGKVVKPIIVNVDDYSQLKPVDVDLDGFCELKGVQRITGIANADTLGYVTSVWKWKGNAWKLKEAAVVQTVKTSLMRPPGPEDED
ncbi:hypothetical protein [Paenibacillus roseipurpureus]|uniref:Uncharacterized protein n=1 Tax=Paenibacillus roseopurpureus TaxID=2918901 RepID=A0AA96RKK4_9BACL|nr:hypothetical protein [Paenibacillus sp. MBLB1832]WNR44449.1 hypothetical protein MJB10_25865 [Paenibacillus sp. MBLB1832]